MSYLYCDHCRRHFIGEINRCEYCPDRDWAARELITGRPPNSPLNQSDRIDIICRAIYSERMRQEQMMRERVEKDPDFISLADARAQDADRFAILLEEFGEVGQAYHERKHPSELRKELIQVAAVAAAWIEAIEFTLAIELAQGRLDV